MRNLSASDVSLSSSDEKHIIFWWEAYQLLIRGSLASYEKLIIFCQKNVTQFHRKQICYHPCSTCPGPNTIISRARDSSKDFAKKVRFSKRIGDANGCGRQCAWCSSVFICWSTTRRRWFQFWDLKFFVARHSPPPRVRQARWGEALLGKIYDGS